MANNITVLDAFGADQVCSTIQTAGVHVPQHQNISEIATASAIPATALMVAGSDGTYLRAISTDSSGHQNVIVVPQTSGGLSTYSGSNGTTVTSVKASAGQIYGYDFYNNNTTQSYVQIFNSLTSGVTLGSTTPFLVLVIPANGGKNIGFDAGITFSTAICFAVTTTRTGNTAPSNNVDIAIYYK